MKKRLHWASVVGDCKCGIIPEENGLYPGSNRVGRVMGGIPSNVKKHPWSIIFYEYTQRQDCHPFHEPNCKPWEPSSISRGQ